MPYLPRKTVLGELSIVEVYHYFDGPRLFLSETLAGRKYLAFWLGEDEKADEWLYLPLSDARLDVIRSAGMGLRAACLDPEGGYVYLVRTAFSAGDCDSAEFRTPDRLNEAMLPRDDAFLSSPTDTLPKREETTQESEVGS